MSQLNLDNHYEVIERLMQITENVLDFEGLAKIIFEDQEDWINICNEYGFDSVYCRIAKEHPEKIGKIL